MEEKVELNFIDRIAVYLFGPSFICSRYGHDPEGKEVLIYDSYWKHCRRCGQQVYSRMQAGTLTVLDRETLKPVKRIEIDEAGNETEVTLGS